jgi:hypothetical protein
MNVENSHRVATFFHLGNIARWFGCRLKWDPEKENFLGDDKANLCMRSAGAFDFWFVFW